MTWLASQSSHVLTCVSLVHMVCIVFCAPGSSSLAPSVHNGSVIWLLSSLFSERFSESGRSKLGSGGCTVLDEVYL